MRSFMQGCGNPRYSSALEIMSGGDEDLAVAHDLLSAVVGFEPDVEAKTDNIDVRRAAPRRAGVLAVGIAEGDVNAGKFFVLEDVANDVIDAEIGADGELAHAIRVFIGVGVFPEVGLKLLVLALAAHDAVLANLDGERSTGQQAIARAEPVPHNAIHDKGAVHFAGRGEALAAGQIAPFLRRDDAGGLEPLVAGIHLGDDVGSRSGGGADTMRAAHALKDLL